MLVTKQAAIELKKALDDFNQPGAGIHIFNAQGCCGPSVQMDITNHLKDDETGISQEGIDFFITTELLSTLSEVTLEFGSNGFRLAGMKKNSSSCCG